MKTSTLAPFALDGNLPATAAPTPDLPADAATDIAHTPAPVSATAVRNRRLWVLALGTAAVWQMDPALGEMAEMIGLIACASNKTLARDAIGQMRQKAEGLRAQIAPLQASALSKVVRRAEAACGAVLDKGIRVKEVQASWDHFMACVRALQETGRR